ncbi:MAG TPA: Uma2 family endonuclease [Acetobacteraceae bacterium]|nr:Uma2 family endonuclease [Acetobacteraceae bacterium]
MRQSMTMEDFLTWEERQELRWEFDGFAPVAMLGGTAGHSLIQGNVITALAIRLRGGPCRAYTSDMKVRLAGSLRYPDAFVVCTPLPRTATLVTDPVVVFEVLSESTARTDHFVKNQEYRATPSIRRYVMPEQDAIGATVFARAGDDWVGHVLGADAVLDTPELGISVPLTELYEGVDFSPPEQD